MSEVLHGEGEPRLVVFDSTNISTLSVVSSTYNSVKFAGNIGEDIFNRQAISKNISGETTSAKIESLVSSNTIYVDEWSNGLPKADEELKIENRVIDLPYCNAPGLVEWDEFLTEEPKTMYFTKMKKRKIIGAYHFIKLDYSEYIPYETIVLLQPIYDFTRVDPFMVYPRKDNMNVGYLCEINSEENLQYRQLQHHQGHKDITFNFEGIELLEKVDLTSNKSLLKGVAGENYEFLAGEDGVILGGD